MAQNLAVSDRVKVRCITSTVDQIGENVFDFRVAALVGAMTDQDLADAMSAVLAPLYKTWLFSGAQYRGLLLQLRRIDTLFFTVKSAISAGAGTGGNDPLPRQITGITTKFTSQAGAGFRGRTYWPFPYKDAADTLGNPTVAQRAKMEALAAQLLSPQPYSAGANTVTLNPELTHKRRADGTTLGPTPITAWHTTQKYATQRRRGDFGSPNTFPV